MGNKYLGLFITRLISLVSAAADLEGSEDVLRIGTNPRRDIALRLCNCAMNRGPHLCQEPTMPPPLEESKFPRQEADDISCCASLTESDRSERRRAATPSFLVPSYLKNHWRGLGFSAYRWS